MILCFEIAIDCTKWDWMKCAGTARIAQCSTECTEGLTSGACIQFLGKSYDKCSNCFSLVEKTKRIGKKNIFFACMRLVS